jgi:MFS family permease
MAAHAPSVFRSRSFTSFYIGQACSYVGDGLRIIAIPLLVYHLTGSALSIGITYALELGPFALFGLVGGSLADRIDRKRLMIACDALRFVVLAVFALGYARGFLTLPILYVGIVLMSLAAATFLGGQASSIPYLVGKDRATSAVSSLMVAEQLSSTVVPPIGGSLFALLGPLPALIANAVTYLLSQTSLALIDDLGPEKPGGLPSLREIGRDIASGFRFAWSDATMRSLSAMSLVLNFFGFVAYAAWIPFLKRDFAASDQTVGIALGVSAIGAFAGSWVAGRIPVRWPFGRVLAIAYVGDGLLFLPVPFVHDLRAAIVFSALANGCLLFEIAQIVGWRIRVTPQAMVGRVFGAVRLVSLIGTVPGAILGGALGDRYGARVALTVSAFGYLAIAAAIGAVPSVRRDRR